MNILSQVRVALGRAPTQYDLMAIAEGAPPAALARYAVGPPDAQAIEGDSDGEVRVAGLITPDAEEMRYFGYAATSAADVRKAFDATSGPVRVRINSPGGSVAQASEIVNRIRERIRDGGAVETWADGMAASAAGLVFLAADTRLMATYATLMYHYSSNMLFFSGTAIELRETADRVIALLTAHDRAMVAGIAQATGLDSAAVAELLKAETWYDPTEAVEQNFATGMIDEPTSDKGGDKGKDGDASAECSTFEDMRQLAHIMDLQGGLQ